MIGARGAAGLALLAALVPACGPRVPASERSVILVTLDTTRADRVGAYGHAGRLTPNLDRIAAEGVLFEDAFSPVPLTLPAHASLLTGRYPASHGVRHNGIYRLRESETTLAEHLETRGFETAAFVGAYVLNRGFGAEQGFGTYDDVPGNRFEGGRDRIFDAQRTAEAVNARVREWIAARGDLERFFLWVHYYDPHDPYAPPEGDRPLTGEGYDREISYMDSCFGDLLRALEERGFLDRSVLAVAADHGESLGEHGERTHGIFLYEGAVRIPLLLRAPGLLPSGRRVSGPAELVDVAPTLLDLLGLPPFPAAQGRSLLARIEGKEKTGGRLAFAESLMGRLEFGWSELRMATDGRFKYIQAPRPELYDLRADPDESENLVSIHPERGGELAGALAEWVARTSDADAEREAARLLDPDEEAQLRSLGYLGGDFFKTGGGEELTDPKDGIAEVRRLDAARDRLAAGDAAGALPEIEAILRANPLNRQARSSKALALAELGRFAEAEEEALAQLAASESDPDASAALQQKARGLLATVLRLGGRDREAEAQYRKILEVDPENGGAATDLARMLIELGRTDEAEPLIAGALRSDPRNGMALAARFLVERRRGDGERALATAAALADARAGDVRVLLEAGGLLQASGDPARAAACYEVALEQQTTLDAGLLGRLGSARLASGNAKGAEEAFRAAASISPGDPRPHHYLGMIALGRGEEGAAREAFSRAVRADPRFSASDVQLARWLARQGRRAEAEAALRTATARNPRDPSIDAARREIDASVP